VRLLIVLNPVDQRSRTRQSLYVGAQHLVDEFRCLLIRAGQIEQVSLEHGPAGMVICVAGRREASRLTSQLGT